MNNMAITSDANLNTPLQQQQTPKPEKVTEREEKTSSNGVIKTFKRLTHQA